MSSLPRRSPHPAGGYAQGLVIRAQDADVGILSQVIADAFGDLPQSRWLIPDRAVRRAIFPGYFRIYVEHAMARGTVHTTTDRTGAALWLPVGENGPQPPDGYDEQLTAATGPWTDRFRSFDATLDRHHPAGTAHHHLAILAVRPDRQGRGIGGQLLRAYHEMLDYRGTPAYLEAATLRLTGLYLRHGYVLSPCSPFRLPDGGPTMWPMWREPREPAGSLQRTRAVCRTTPRPTPPADDPAPRNGS